MSRFAIRPIVASLAVTLAAGAFAGTASAAPSSAAPSSAAPSSAAPSDTPAAARSGADHMGKHGASPRGHHFQGMRDALWLPGVGPIGKQEVAKLKLDARQQALFDAARQAQQDFRTSMRESMMTRHKTLDTQLQAGKLDPHALADAQSQSRQARQSQADQVRQKWLAVWDSLNEAQRQQVTSFVKERQARWEQRRKEGRPGMGHHPAAPADAPPSAT